VATRPAASRRPPPRTGVQKLTCFSEEPMLFPESVSSCVVALFLSGATIHARAYAGEPGEISGPLRAVDVNVDVNSDGDAPKPLVAEAVQRSYQPLTGKERWDLHLRDAFWSPGVFFRAAGPALGA
jgi:hypothetical protein